MKLSNIIPELVVQIERIQSSIAFLINDKHRERCEAENKNGKVVSVALIGCEFYFWVEFNCNFW